MDPPYPHLTESRWGGLLLILWANREVISATDVMCSLIPNWLGMSWMNFTNCAIRWKKEIDLKFFVEPLSDCQNSLFFEKPLILSTLVACIIFNFWLFKKRETLKKWIRKCHENSKDLHTLSQKCHIRELESWAFHAGKENSNYRKKPRVLSMNKNGWYQSHYGYLQLDQWFPSHQEKPE